VYWFDSAALIVYLLKLHLYSKCIFAGFSDCKVSIVASIISQQIAIVCVCRVRGVKSLRIIDASIIPSSLSGNSYTTQVMIAEKAADMVREKDTVKAIKEYFKHLLEIKHKKFTEEEESPQNRTDKK